MNRLLFEGSAVAIVTPFTEDGVDFESFGRLIDFQIENHTDAIVVCGTTGESATMPDSEHLSVIEYAVKRVNGRIPVIGGAGSNDTVHGAELCREASKLGIDGLLLVTPYYNKTSQRGLVKHYEIMADAVNNLPIILYNVPGRTGVNITPATTYELSKIDNIVGVKEASGDLVQAISIAKLCGPDFYIYSGNDDINVPLMSIGAKGSISVLSNILPYETHMMCKYALDGDFKKAAELQIKYMDLIKSLFCEVNPIPIKTALNLAGHKVGNLRMPLFEMAPENIERLKSDMIKAGIKLQ